MKHHFLQKTTLLCAGAALVLGTMPLRAGEPKNDDGSNTTNQQKHVVTKTHVTTKTTTTVIPTRDGRSAKYSDGGPVGGSNGHEHAVLTGSQIPRSYIRRGYSTDSDENAFIYDKNDIRLRSTNTVQDSLRSVPGVTVRGIP